MMTTVYVIRMNGGPAVSLSAAELSVVSEGIRKRQALEPDDIFFLPTPTNLKVRTVKYTEAYA